MEVELAVVAALAAKRRANRSRFIQRRRMFINVQLAKRRATERKLALFLILAISSINLHYTSQRLLWSKERSGQWWDHIVKTTFTDRDWYDNFRMSHATFDFLCNSLNDFLEKKRHRDEKCNSCRQEDSNDFVVPVNRK